MLSKHKRLFIFLGFITLLVVWNIQYLTSIFADTSNLALGKTVTVNGYTQVYVGANATDGSTSTYWEGTANNYPSIITVDLGSSQSIYKVVLKLNSSWESRTQTLAVLGSTDNSAFTTLVASTPYTFNSSNSNTVTITFSSATTRYIRLNITANSGATAGQVAELEVYGSGTGTSPTNLALNKSIVANNAIQTYVAVNANDGSLTTYWEGAANSYPNILTVDLGASQTINQVVISLNPGSTWATRTQTFSVLGSTDNSTFTTIMAAGTYTFNPSTGNSVTISFTPLTTRYVRLSFTANSGATGGQVGEIGVYNTNSSSRPDLIVQSISWSPANPSSGNAVTFSAIIKNQGGASVPAGTISTLSFYVDGTLVSSNASYSSSIASGATVTLTGAATWTASSGSHTIQAIVDGGNVISESDETNNSYLTQLTIGTIGGKYEAEQAALSGTAEIDTDHTGYSGTGFVGGYWYAGPATTFTVSVASAGWYDATLRYGNAMGNNRTLSIYVNGVDKIQSTFPNLSSWDRWSDKTETLYLNAGSNTISYKFDSDDTGNINLDYMTISSTTSIKPDLTITGISWTPATPSETDSPVLTATVKNNGNGSASASTVDFYLNNIKVGTVTTPVIAAGGSISVSANIGAQDAGTYRVSAVADQENALSELDEGNNNFTASSSLVVLAASTSDLVVSTAMSPENPNSGTTVSFMITLANQGTMVSGSGNHALALVLKNSAGEVIRTYNSTYSGSLSAGGSVNVIMGTWGAADGSYTLTANVAADTNEIAKKQENNQSVTSISIGRGAHMPYTKIEAESSSVTTNGTKLPTDYRLGNYAGEASGRSAIYLDATGEYVQFTLTSPANAFVLRNAVAEGASGTVSVYADGVRKGTFAVSSKFSYVYASPTTLSQLGYNNTASGTAYWLYEDAQLMLDQVYPVGTKIKVQIDSGDIRWIYVDFLEFENVAAAAANPDPAKYVEVSSTKSIDAALQEFRNDSTKLGIFIPAGTWEISNKIFLYGRATQIIGAGPWWTKLTAPQGSSNTDVGFNISSAANGSLIKNLSAWGNYQYRVDGPGKFIDGDRMQNVTVDNVWIEHFICMYWGIGSSYNTFKNCRIRNTFADGINMTNGSSYNQITNCDARGTGDDSFALFSATDSGGSYNVGNVYSNLSATCTRRAACFAIYGGSNNQFQNLYGADSLTYPGITINSYSFGYSTLGFGDEDTVFDGVTLDRTGGDFWTSSGADSGDKINDYQNFGAIWFYCGDRAFKNILVKNVDINNPVYYGLMFQTKYSEALSMQNIRLENVNVNNAPRYGIKLVVKAEDGQGPVLGSASFKNVKINNPGLGTIYGQSACPGFIVTKIGEDNNW